MNGRRMIAAGVVAGAVTVGAVAGALIGIPGLSGATSSSGASGASGATGSTTPDDGPHFHGFFGHRDGDGNGVLDAAAKALNLSTKDLLEKLSDGKTTIADVAGQQNVDVQTVIDAMEAVSNQHIQDLVNNPLPARPDFPGGRMGGRHGFGFIFGMPGMGKALDPIAKALGITTDELQTDLQNGQSVADIAKAKNVDLNTIVDALVKDAQARFDEAVKAGTLSQDQADKLEANLKDMITAFVNNDMPKGLDGPGRWRMHGGPDAPWPGAPDAPAEASPSAAAAI